MRKLIVFGFLFFSTILFAQEPGLVIQGATPNFYLNHIVAPKEGLYSIARAFNLAPKVLAAYNNLTIDKGLSIGQVVKIPLTEQNFEQQGKSTSDESLIDLYHVVGKSETLFRIGNNHKVAVDNIKQWSKLSSDNIESGLPLVVGHLKVKSDQVAYFNGGSVAAPQTVAKSEPVKVPVTTKIEEPKKAVTEKAVPQAEVPAATTIPVNKPAEEVTATDIPLNKTVADSKPVVVSGPPTVTRKEDRKPTETSAEVQNKSIAAPILSTSDEGAFLTLYTNTGNASMQQNSGQAGTFKSTSGWQDKKYYVLMNNINPGTILKITSGDNKSVYAKVLGAMPDMKENNGLLLRMSNAAASYLGIIDPKFPVQISYYQ